MGLHQIKKLCAARGTINKMKKKHMDAETVPASHKADKGPAQVSKTDPNKSTATTA